MFANVMRSFRSPSTSWSAAKKAHDDNQIVYNVSARNAQKVNSTKIHFHFYFV